MDKSACIRAGTHDPLTAHKSTSHPSDVFQLILQKVFVECTQVTQGLDASILFPQLDPTKRPLLLSQIPSEHTVTVCHARSMAFKRSNSAFEDISSRKLTSSLSERQARLVPPSQWDEILLVFAFHAFHLSAFTAHPVLTQYLFDQNIVTPVLRLDNLRIRALSPQGAAKGSRYLSVKRCSHITALFDILA
ncbi:hypothetical protein BS17DRAFT_59061 [Gyrodon lividus]|nr:hypothetical protein BS17DRAFT_59061 [Gyrodon lividus]